MPDAKPDANPEDKPDDQTSVNPDEKPTQAPDEANGKPLRLVPVAGPAIDLIVLKPGTRSLLGRSAECDFCLHEPSVSRQPVAVENRDGQWFATDLGSSHGVFLNGVRLSPQKPAPIGQGDLLRIGPFIFRAQFAGSGSREMATMISQDAPGTLVEAVPRREFDSIAHRRLALIIEGCASIHQAATEVELAQAVVKLMIAGTGFPRAAMLRWSGSLEQVEIVASHERFADDTGAIVFSQSLLETASTGSVARLSHGEQANFGQSIAELGITAALCTPLIVDSTVVGAVYLDSRDGEGAPQPDAASFCQAVAQVAGVALSSLKRIELAQRQQQLDADLEIAQEAQSFLLPEAEGTVGPLRYASRSCPGAAIGGDLFDIFAVDENRTGICFGDITGHGIGAAVLMSAVISHLRATLSSGGDPAAAVGEVNDYLVSHSSSRMFATLWVGVYDETRGVLSYVDAGHGHWLVCKPGEAPACPQTMRGLMIGLQPDFAYTTAHLELKGGDRFVLYSDGIVEQPDKLNDRFEIDRLGEVIAASGSIADDVAGVFTALESFCSSGTFMDDTTLASIEVCGQ
jgi:phosphoserine phosphatase RsbU/P